ncbi:VWA domain-containing protein [Escherichia coli]|nr:VWA domain-containing protein [Salmonella enterica subsp. enterica serovar Uganda]EFH8816962.1 hypothetical protein [Escherichia coli]EFO4438669.1 VWA domain-containing protein [Escherichia coli]EII9948123.1 VWA domain-containing protein [Escherichia coli]
MKLDLKSSPRHIKRLQNIAKVISGLGDVRVVIDDNTKGPYFDPVNKVCVLPNGDYSDDDFVSLIEGFTCHEAGHGRYTDSEVYSDAFNSVLKSSEGFTRFDDGMNAEFESLAEKRKAYSRAKRLTGLINLFDDVQMEEKVGNDYPDAKRRLAATYALMVKAGRMTPDISSRPENPVLFIEWYLLNSLRVKVLQQAGHKETLDPFFDYAQKILSPVISDVEEIFHDALGCENTQGCESLARKTLALLERLRDEAREQQQQTEQEEQEAYDESETETETDTESEDKSLESTDSREDDSEDDSEGQADTSDNSDLAQEGCSEPSELAEDNEGNNEPTGGNPTGDNIIEDDTDAINPSESESDEASSTNVEDESNFSSAQWEILADLLDAFLGSDEDSEDYHDALAKEIEGIASKVSDDVKAEFGASEWDIPDLLIDLNVYNEALSLSHSIGSDLSVLQQVKMRGRNKTHERGITFDGNRLILSPMGVRDVFRAQSESKNRGHVGLVLVRDISVSMANDERYIHAIKSDLALSMAAESLSKMHVSNIVFPFKESEFEIIKTFDQSVEESLSKFTLGCKGYYTPTGSALMAAVDLLLDSQFDRKIIFLITDGYPNKSEFTIGEVMEKAKCNGIEIVGVGIKTDEIIGFETDTFVTVDDTSLLSIEVSKLVHQILS